MKLSPEILPEILPDIKEFTKEELTRWFQKKGIQPYRTTQIMRWIYLKQVDSFDEMTDISKNNRQLLSTNFSFSKPEKKQIESSVDGSKKYLFGLQDGNCIETVLIPEKNHYTLCISTQVGCAMGCRFCMTAQSGLIRNLTQAEIINQVLGTLKDITGKKRLTNIVLMGMGEPLANYENVIRAIHIFTDNDSGLQFSTRRVTLSTCGLIPRFDELGRDTKINLAISLNATDNPTRSMLMPINKKYPIEHLIDACARYQLAPRNKITFEYILIRDINDSIKDANRLAKLLRPVKAKINLIPFNEHPGSEFKCPDETVVLKFQEVLHQKSYTAIIRHSKGRDISAACGQLSAKNK
ncbi:MAG: 23S rRNA (adenine(2503)-C(2))-methyltransferase RlmN [Desulfobacteraceae bacterium]|nr:23S rRNA (adenine(2503)-C(2))-methyltransferase RlmN [Desulfobacteraceae bacterium]MBC2754668.1 23S rRNA (adenine(2503)-C(2))-methyltransferase RlmN [Desulfobacteraceae bacterium]